MPLNNDTPGARNNPKPMEQADAGKPLSDQKKTVKAAHDEAEKDIENDPDLNSKPSPEDDLDEGEIARLESGDDLP